MLRNLTPREEKLLQFLNATGIETVEKTKQAYANIAYNIMMGNLEDPTQEVEE